MFQSRADCQLKSATPKTDFFFFYKRETHKNNKIYKQKMFGASVGNTA